MSDELTTSALIRLARLGGLVGRVSASLLGAQVADLVRGDSEDHARVRDNLARNAARIVETLGDLKGAAMKVGQMVSLHEGFLPPEVASALRKLQSSARCLPVEVMEAEMRSEIPDFDERFESIEPEAFAAASIGQVHRGRLRDGRRVAVKIQYPEIDRVVRADLKNLRTVMMRLFSLLSDVDFDPVWREVRARLLEELDYTREAANMKRMAELHADVPEIVIPPVVDEATTRRVLTMHYLEGIPPGEACSTRYGPELRDRWGVALFEFQMRGLFVHRLMHADPNLANFAFLESGRVIVYDFGCLKRVPRDLALGYAELARAVLDDRRADIPGILHRMGVHKEGGVALSAEVIDPYVELFEELFRESPPYTFGEDPEVYRKLLDLGIASFHEARDIRFPAGVVFIDRALAGHFGNLGRLHASGPWRELLGSYAEAAGSR